MLNRAVARRYSRALFDIATERGVLDQVDRELDLVVSMIEMNRPLRAIMNDVLIAPKVKRDLVSKLLQGKVSEVTMSFLLLVVRKRREAHYPEIYRAFLDLANEARGIVEVEVRSAVPLEAHILTGLENKLVARFGKRIKFQTQVAPELIGGLVVRVGDELMDGSIKTRLRRIRDRLVSAKSE